MERIIVAVAAIGVVTVKVCSKCRMLQRSGFLGTRDYDGRIVLALKGKWDK